MKVKKLLSMAIIMMILSIILLPVSAFAAEKSEMTNTQENINIGDIDILVNVDLGLVIVTQEVAKDGTPIGPSFVGTDFSQNINPLGPTDKEASTTFSHNIYDRNNILMATVLCTVKGLYSQVDSYAEITSITATISGAYASQFSYSTSKSGADGYLYLYYNGLSAGNFHYHIYTNGNIVNN